jgi:hypothetical protein
MVFSAHLADAGPAWERSFSATYTEFVLNATRIYNKPKLPIFVAQGTFPHVCPEPVLANDEVCKSEATWREKKETRFLVG